MGLQWVHGSMVSVNDIVISVGQNVKPKRRTSLWRMPCNNYDFDDIVGYVTFGLVLEVFVIQQPLIVGLEHLVAAPFNNSVARVFDSTSQKQGWCHCDNVMIVK